jgi:hypothetical protein
MLKTSRAQARNSLTPREISPLFVVIQKPAEQWAELHVAFCLHAARLKISCSAAQLLNRIGRRLLSEPRSSRESCKEMLLDD